MRQSRAVVTGITGHVGRELARQLVEAGVDVHGLTRQAPTAVSSFPGHVSLHRVDNRTETLVEVLQEVRPDAVIHLAAFARRDHHITDVVTLVEANILFGAQLLEATRRSGCQRFITTGSILQYSDAGEYRPFNLYSATKQSFVDLLLYYTQAFELSAITLTLPTIYSEYESAPKLMTDIASAWENGTSLTLQGDSVPIDFVHVEDVASAILEASLLLESQSVRKEGSLSRYCVTSGGDITPHELVALFERIGERKIIVRREVTQNKSRRTRPWHGPVVPGWVPHIDLETGIKRVLLERTARRRRT